MLNSNSYEKTILFQGSKFTSKLEYTTNLILNLLFKNFGMIFEFNLSNNTGNEASYLSPCGEFGEFLKIYREDTEGIYEYVGKSEYNSAAVAVYIGISDDETTLLGRIPWDSVAGWPEIEPGKYYVGDTFSLEINDTICDFTERIYFETH